MKAAVIFFASLLGTMSAQAEIKGFMCESHAKPKLMELVNSGKYTKQLQGMYEKPPLFVTMADVDLHSGDNYLTMWSPNTSQHNEMNYPLNFLTVSERKSFMVTFRSSLEEIKQYPLEPGFQELGKVGNSYEFFYGNKSDLELYNKRDQLQLLTSTIRGQEAYMRFFQMENLNFPKMDDPNKLSYLEVSRVGNQILYKDYSGNNQLLAEIENNTFIQKDNELLSISCSTIKVNSKNIRFYSNGTIGYRVTDPDDLEIVKGYLTHKEIKVRIKGIEYDAKYWHGSSYKPKKETVDVSNQ